MATGEYLGKISKVSFGHGGYQDVQIGISFTLEGEMGAVGDFWGDWGIARSDSAQWSEADRIVNLGNTVMRINKLLKDAKKTSIEKLVGIPVKIIIEGNILKEWRVLMEVL